MGYATAVGTPGVDGPTVRSDEAAAHGKLMTGIGDCQNLYESFLRGARTRPASPCFGSRVRDDGSVGSYEWQTYQEVKARVEAFAAGAWKLDLVPRAPDGKRFLGFFLKNSAEWMVGALACYKTGVTVVPMYDTLGADVVQYIQQQTLCTSASSAGLPSRRPLGAESCPLPCTRP